MSRFLSAKYQKLEAYTPGEQPKDRAYIKLNTNESPYAPSPEVLSAVSRETMEKLRLYPDPEGQRLRRDLGKLYGLTPEHVFLSNGSDDSLNFAFMAFAGDGRRAMFPEISYSFYPVYANLHGIDYDMVPLKNDFSIDPADYFHKGAFLVIANPNAPTGMALSREEIRSILETNPYQVVLIDEAYVDFGGESSYPLIHDYPNLLVVMTFSKSRSLAGARLGFALGNPELIEDLERLRYSTNPYNINRLTLAIGEAAVASNAYFAENCKRIMENRERVRASLLDIGFEVLPSQANFLFLKKEAIAGETLYRRLKECGILVRHFSKKLIADYIRVTIGTREEMDAFLKEIKTIVSEEVSYETG